MGGDAGSHGSPDPGGWRGRQLPESQPRGKAPPKGQKTTLERPLPGGEHPTAFERAPRRCGTPGVREPTARQGRGAGTKPGPERASRLRELRSAHLSGSLDVSPRRLAALPSPRQTPDRSLARSRARTLFLTSAESP